MWEGRTGQVNEGVEDLRRLGGGAGALRRRWGWWRQIHVQVHGVCVCKSLPGRREKSIRIRFKVFTDAPPTKYSCVKGLP